MTQRSGILAAGNWIVDHVKLIDTWPSEETLAIISRETQGMGGAPPNVLAGLARLGAKFPLSGAGIVGYDAAGDWILEQCAKLGIDTRLLTRTNEGPTSYTDVMNVEHTGRRTFFHQRGVNALLGPESIDLASCSARLFHLGYLLLLDRLDRPEKSKGTAAAELLDHASRLGFITSVDAVSEESDRYPRIVLPALPYVDLVFLNEFEASHVFSTEIRVNREIDVNALLKTAQDLRAAGVRQWVIIHFPEGVLAVSNQNKIIFQPSVRLPGEKIIGSTGAGDAIAAGILFGFHDDLPMERCLEIGVCAAAASLRHPSATEGMEAVDGCLRLGQEFGFRESIFGSGDCPSGP
ncbi:MAG TPA: carbohydrate kinase family protein [Chthoniobacterales bacterium]